MPNMPTYTTMTESWANMDTPPAVTTYTVDSPSDATLWTINTVYPNGTKGTQLLINRPNQWDDGLLYRATIYDSAGNQLQRTGTTWEQGDYYSPRVKVIEEIDQLGQAKVTDYAYSTPTNQLTEVSTFVYLQPQKNPILRKVITDYLTDPYFERHIFNLPQRVTVSDQSGVTFSRTEYVYDNQALADAPGVVGYSDPGTDYRGNITQVTRYADASTPANPVVESRQYDITGNLVVRSDVQYEQTSYTFDQSTQYAYPIAVTWGAADPKSAALMTKSFTYDFGTGLLLTSTDPNGRITQYTNDPVTLRLQQMTLPTGGYTRYSYDDAEMQTGQSVWTADGKSAGETVTLFNGLGLVQQVETRSDPGFWTAVTTRYDSMGRMWKRSQPYVWLARGSQAVFTTFSYDALGRITSVQDPNGDQWTWHYDEPQRPDSASAAPGQTVRVQSPAIAWSGKKVSGTERWYRMDALGFLAEVVQPSAYGPGGSVFDPGSVKTSYVHNPLGLLLEVIQGPQGQRRIYRYDGLGRLSAQYTPEKSKTLNDAGNYVGTVASARWSDFFTYDTRSNLASHMDARGVQTVYQNGANPADPPDPLNRLYRVFYTTTSGDTSILPTYPADYQYVASGDVTRIAKVTTNAIGLGGRLSRATQDYSYDTEGRLAERRLSLNTPLAHPALKLDYSYDTLHRPARVTYPAEVGTAGRKNVDYSYDKAGRLANLQVDGADYASGLVYDPAGQSPQSPWDQLDHSRQSRLTDMTLSRAC